VEGWILVILTCNINIHETKKLTQVQDQEVKGQDQIYEFVKKNKKTKNKKQTKQLYSTIQ